MSVGMSYGLLLAWVASVHGAPSWPIMFSYSPDSMPIIQVRLAPPHKPLAEVSAFLSKLDADRVRFETANMLEVEAAYNESWEEASEKLPALIDRLMQVFEKPSVLLSLRRRENELGSRNATSFTEVRGKPGGHELTARINLLPVRRPEPALESHIQAIEDKRSKDERNIFRQAVSEMAGLTKIVQNELEAQITRHASNLLHALRFGLGASSSPSLARSVSFLSAHQPVLASGPPLTTNVRITASDEPFPTIAAMTEDLERRRDASEDLVRTRLLELELKLLQAENRLVSERLGNWVEYVMRASV